MLIFLFGEDTYRSQKKLNFLKEKFLAGEKGPSNLFHLSGEAVNEESLKKTFSSQQLFSQKKLTIIEKPFSLNKDLIKKISDFIDEIERDKNNILILYEGKVEMKNLEKSTKELFLRLKRLKYAEEFSSLRPWQLKTFIKNNFLPDATIEEEALDLLIESLGNNLWAIENELNKLLFLKERKRLIKAEEVEKLILKTNQKIFKLIDAVGNKEKKTALKLLNEQVEAGIGIENILSLLIRQYSLILRLKISPKKRMSVHPYVLQKALEEETKYSLEKIKKIYSELLKIDFLRKTRPIDPQILLNLLIVKTL